MAATSVQYRDVRPRSMRLLGLAVGLALLLLVMLSSILFGAADIGPSGVWGAIFAYDDSTEHLIIRTLRVPRALVAASVGASLAVAGAIMQGITRNPMASPGLLGINAGAALAVVVAVFLLGTSSLALYAWFAFAGAGAAAVGVYALGSMGRGGGTPLKLTIAGAALAALLSSLTTGILILNQRTLDQIRFWLAGSVAGRDLELFLQAFPYMAGALVAAWLLSPHVTALSLGEDVA